MNKNIAICFSCLLLAASEVFAALPDSCRAIAVLEQTKESGAPGEPLYIDVVTTLAQAVGGSAP